MKNISVILASLCALFFIGCSTVNTVERADPQSRPTRVNDKRVITDGSLDDYAYVAAINESRVGGLLKIQARIVNSSTSAENVNYKFDWLDGDGMAVSSATSPWGTLVIEGGESKYISAVAPSKNVCDFTLKLLPNVRD